MFAQDLNNFTQLPDFEESNLFQDESGEWGFRDKIRVKMSHFEKVRRDREAYLSK